MFITNSPAPSRINSAELSQREVTVWEFAIFGYFPCIIRTVRTCSFNHKHKHRKMAIFVIFSPVFFLFLELGIFLFKLGKKLTFWHWEHDRISVVKTGQKKPLDLLLVSTRHCYMLHIYGFRKEHFLSFSHNRSIEAITPKGVTSFDHKGLVGWIYVGHHLTLLHTCTKYKSCGPHGFR